ncbi:MAG: ferrous iron transport protein A [Candidatus Aminicenantes bacterium]|nr:ferrous iron transport protein A [Candidatus Aminicenantes bacterium]
MKLTEAPYDKPLRIASVQGGEGVRRRLLALGFHQGDRIMIVSSGILQGPILVRNLAADVTVALGRGVAFKILVEPDHV